MQEKSHKHTECLIFRVVNPRNCLTLSANHTEYIEFINMQKDAQRYFF
jgi:hypothetical protein